jgi:hypothetical protein
MAAFGIKPVTWWGKPDIYAITCKKIVMKAAQRSVIA